MTIMLSAWKSITSFKITPPPFPSNKKIAQAVTVLTCLLRKYPVRATAGANAIILLLLLLLLLLLTAIGLSPGGRV